MKKIRFTILLLTLLTGLTSFSIAQSSLTAENMALGGGGSAYLTGFESLFVNPANLYIQEKNYSLQISLLQGGAYFDTALPVPGSRDRFSMYKNSHLPYTQVNENRFIDDAERESILQRNYPDTRQISTLQSQTDFYWFGMKWYRSDRSYAVALRTRSSSIYEIGRGNFSSSAIERNGTYRVDKSFRHNYQSMHELSFGYAESFTFLNGLIPRLSEFIVGVAPKIVLAGSYLDAEYLNVYEREEELSAWNRRSGYVQKGSGYLGSGSGPPYQNDGMAPPSPASLSDILKPSGIGFGIDIGITYLITFGSDLSVLRREDMPTEKSLRFSFSINDLGAIYHYRDVRQLHAPEMEDQAITTGQLSDRYFLGAPNEHISFLSQFNNSPFEHINEISEENFETFLPATINAGALFQINRLKLMGDISYSLAKTNLSANTPVAFVGVELRPLAFLPLRAGTRLAPRLPGFYSFGTGIETSYFDLSAAVQLKSRSIGPTTEILAASLVGIKFYIP